MKKLVLGTSLLIPVLFFTNCKKSETTTSSNISSQVVQNLQTISANYSPDSLSSVSTSSASIQSSDDPCEGVTDFAVCQSNLVKAYISVGKDAVDSVSTLASQVGRALGEVPDGNSGTSSDGKISWSKTSSDVWSILTRNASNGSIAYFSVNNGVYTLKLDQNNAETNPLDQQIEAVITYNNESDWDVDVYFGNNECDATDVDDPSKVRIKMARSSGLWTGKAMIYVPRWQTPGSTAPTCATTSGANDIAMYTDFVGNNASTKAALYLIPTTESGTSYAAFDLPGFCTNFASTSPCGGGAGQIPPAFLNSYPNNWCTTGPNTTPTWGDSCSTNSAVNSASYSSGSNWTAPSVLKGYSVTMPTSL
ncbi:MAG: hypothetical protein K0R29_1972 [Pseudobdellovibrio sp.]|nr:hypothetical protein [Pseudobdellovibrio sp.]